MVNYQNRLNKQFKNETKKRVTFRDVTENNKKGILLVYSFHFVVIFSFILLNKKPADENEQRHSVRGPNYGIRWKVRRFQSRTTK